MRVPTIGILRLAVRLAMRIFGEGLGRVRLFQHLFRRFVSLAVPIKHVLVLCDGYRLGMTVGGHRGWDEEALSLLFGNGYEVEMTKLFKSVVKPDMNVVDVGAHIGYYTVLASRLVGNGGKVWAFEPDPKNYAELLDNLKLNECSNVVAVPKAIGSKTGTAKLYFYGEYSGQRSLVDIGHKPHNSIDAGVIPLDEFIGKQRVDVVKIDVDGGETEVLESMAIIVRSNPQAKIFTEVWETGLKDAGHSCHEFWRLLSEYGFRHVYLIDDRRGRVEPIRLEQLLEYVKKIGGANIFCSRGCIV